MPAGAGSEPTEQITHSGAPQKSSNETCIPTQNESGYARESPRRLDHALHPGHGWHAGSSSWRARWKAQAQSSPPKLGTNSAGNARQVIALGKQINLANAP